MPARSPSGSDNIPAGLEVRRFPPRFIDPQIEKEFRLEYAHEVRPHVRFGLLTATVVWICVLPLGFTLGPDVLTLMGGLGLIVMLTLMATAALAGTFIKQLTRAMPAFTTVANMVTGLACIFLGYVVLNTPMLTLGGLLITMMYAAAFFRLRTLAALWATLPYALVMSALLFIDPSTSPADISVMSFLLFVSELTTLAAVYVNDNSSRRAFIQRRIIDLQAKELVEERAKSDRLLLNVLPAAIVTRLRQRQEIIAEAYPDVTILFSDVVGFTPLSDKMAPAELVTMLNRLFTQFDELAAKHGLEKIKTIGDAYMAASGVPLENTDHANAAAEMALGMMRVVEELNRDAGLSLKMRIGLNTGSVIAGVIGKQKFSYDLWGDAVNTAARMESHGVAGQVQLSDATKNRLDARFEIEDRGLVDIKGKGQMHTWLLRGKRA